MAQPFIGLHLIKLSMTVWLNRNAKRFILGMLFIAVPGSGFLIGVHLISKSIKRWLKK